MKSRLLYLMHVDWSWIKQRPHFIAETLSTEYDLFVFYAVSRKRKSLTANNSLVKRWPMVLLPFSLPLVDFSVKLLYRLFFSVVLAVLRPTVIWITHPRLFEYLPPRAIVGRALIYDCMDDATAFPGTTEYHDEIVLFEQSLLRRADCVFCSSENLRSKLIGRGCDSTKIRIVRNAYDGHKLSSAEVLTQSDAVYKICYFGTISVWVDFEVLLFSLERISALEYHFYGPSEIALPEHPRLIFHGTIDHENLYRCAGVYDCFILPFRVTPLVESVDPVKLYEYINLARPVISIRYAEIERFRDFVYFYDGTESLLEAISLARQQGKAKYTAEQRLSFLERNSWERRGVDILLSMNDIEEKLHLK